MNKLTAFALLAASLLFAGCSSFSASVDYDRTFDFGKIKTYRWTRLPGGSHADPVAGEIIHQVLDAELRFMGYKKVLERPDFRVAGSLQTQRGQTNWGGRYGGGGYSYEAATLIIAMFDNEGNIFWYGIASDVTSLGAAAEEKQKALSKAIKAFFEDFPPEPEQ